MTAHRGPGVRQVGSVGTTPKEHRLSIAGQYAETAPGIPRSGLLRPSQDAVVLPTGSAAPMSYDVVPIAAVINRSIGEGVYTPTTSGTSSVATAAAPASGSRWDLIWIKQNDSEKSDANNDAILGVTSGTAAASPSRPTGSVPAGALVIAEARIYSGTTTTTQSPNTVTPVYLVTAARGADIPVSSVADRESLAKRPGLKVIRLDRDAHVQMWNGTKWQWVSQPDRYLADPATFNTASTIADKLIGTVTAAPTRAYATQVRVNGRLTMSTGSISSGSVRLSMGVSATVATAGAAQAKSLATFTAPGSLWETRAAETPWLPVAVSQQVLARMWIIHTTGAVASRGSADVQENHLWVEVLPADD